MTDTCQFFGCDAPAEVTALYDLMRPWLPNLIPPGTTRMCGYHHDKVATDRSSLYEADDALNGTDGGE